MSKLSVIILAAGKGTRMKSALPKVLHKLAGKPLVEHVYDTAKCIGADNICVVYGHQGDRLLESCSCFESNFVEQKQQLGTGHAVDQAIPHIDKDDTVLILYGDVPLTKQQTLTELVNKVDESTLSLLTVELENPAGYGRIIRNDIDQVVAIVEEKDASDQQKSIAEVNTGILALKAHILIELLEKVENNNVQNEYYLTDIIGLAAQKGMQIEASAPDDEYEVAGINDRIQLAKLERIYQRNAAELLMQSGVTLTDPERIDIRGTINVGQDIIIDINVIFEGEVTLGDNVQIDAGCIISDSIIGDNTHIKANSVIENATIGSQVEVGPFARVRPGTELADRSKIGNFVETKKAIVGVGSKINHLSYVGDAVVGNDVNIGAGTITCNYDGANKHQTIIKDNAFIGSDSQLVAPVTIGENVTVAAGSTITSNTEDDVLVISRVKQRSISSWKRPTKKKS